MSTMPEVREVARMVLVGSRDVFESTAERFSMPRPWCCGTGDVEIMDIGSPEREIVTGAVSKEAGRLSAISVDTAIRLALDGAVHALVTAPIHKEAWHRAGLPFPGHTEMLGDRTGVDDFGLMLVQDTWRVLHVSTHVSLRRAIELVTEERLLRMMRLFHRTLRSLGCAEPKIGVAGLNPHAGEGGLFGEEEQTIITPAIEAARSDGIDAVGPVPPDTVFARGRAGEYDGVLAMYHDQGHVAMKTVAFEPGPDGRWDAVRGVNVTVGLPIIRTSVDHGVAFDIVDRGIARPESMVEAIMLAAQMARSRSD